MRGGLDARRADENELWQIAHMLGIKDGDDKAVATEPSPIGIDVVAMREAAAAEGRRLTADDMPGQWGTQIDPGMLEGLNQVHVATAKGFAPASR